MSIFVENVILCSRDMRTNLGMQCTRGILTTSCEWKGGCEERPGFRKDRCGGAAVRGFLCCKICSTWPICHVVEDRRTVFARRAMLVLSDVAYWFYKRSFIFQPLNSR